MFNNTLESPSVFIADGSLSSSSSSTQGNGIGTGIRITTGPAVESSSSSRSSSSSWLGGAGGGATFFPRFRTLESYGSPASGLQAFLTVIKKAGADSGISIVELLAANVEAAAQVQKFETISGRAAMICLLTAVGLEVFTGDSVFSGVDGHTLAGVGMLSFLACVSATSFALLLRAKNHAAAILALGCKNLVDSAVDNLIDGIFFDDIEDAAGRGDGSSSSSSSSSSS